MGRPSLVLDSLGYSAYPKRSPAEYQKRHGRFAKYGMTHEQYESLVVSQDGRCGICDRKAPLSVDHNLQTMDIRGLLCRGCNSMLGWYERRKDIIDAWCERSIGKTVFIETNKQ